MPDAISFVEANAQSEQALRELLAGLSDSDLARPVSDTWTVAAVLAHMAFWDFRAAAVVDRWLSDSVLDPFAEDPLTNAVLDPFLRSIAPRAAVQLALQAAAAADSGMARLAANPDLAARIAALEASASLDRSEHRREHLAQIASVLGR